MQRWGLRVHVAAAVQGSVAAYGISCGPVLGAVGVPRIGGSLDLTAANLPASMAVAYDGVGLGNARFGASVLPLPLDSYGAPGCWLLHDFAVVTGLPMTVTGFGANSRSGCPPTPV